MNTSDSRSTNSPPELASLVPAGVFACDANGYITFFNRYAEGIWGRAPGIGVDRYCGSVRAWKFDGQPLPHRETAVGCALARGARLTDFEYVLERTDGTRIACSAAVEVQRDPNGQITGAVAVLQDITERRRAEELLGRQADLLSQTHDAIFAWDWSGSIVFWNRGAERLYGFSATEALGRKTSEVIRSEPARNLDLLRERVSRFGQVTEELVQYDRSERRRTVESRAVMSRSFDSQPVVLETSRDITERREMEVALRANEEQLRLAIDAGRVGTWSWDMTANRVVWSRHIFNIHGLEPGAFGGDIESFTRLVHPDDVERVGRIIHDTIESGAPYSAEMRIVRPTGEVRWIFTNGQVFYDADRKPRHMIGATVDITDRKRAEEHLERAVAERTAKLQETVGELEAFSYSVSHDLRAPLRVMQGYAVALLEDASPKLAGEEKQYLERIARAAQRLDHLINDVLAYSRLARTEVHFSPVNLDFIIQEVLQQYPFLDSHRASIEVRKPLGRVFGHDALIVQAVSNILVNAVKFVPPGVAPKVEVYSEFTDESVRLWISDNGIGIAPHNRQRVFGMFQRLNPESEYEGTGIGLSIVKKAVERMGGSVGVEANEHGPGSRFWVELRRAPAP